MKRYLFLSIFLFFYSYIYSQVTNDTIGTQVQDTSVVFKTQMEEMFIGKDKAYMEEMERIKKIQRRVFKVYPYAKLAAENLKILNANMAKLKTEREKKKYFKIVENYLENEFEDRLKKFSRKEGQVLVKLIHRQTGETTFKLVKDLKSGWKAFWSNNTARLFDINLKEEYDPMNELDDFYIEGMLIKAFKEGKLQRQDPAKPIDLAELSATWKERLNKSRKAREEKAAKEKALEEEK
ncbi:hypothetical protein FCR2A7T_29330 [Flavobacterium cauense R2A-7]|uniref:Uncharacterized protein DUF4294 n=1 Tax=Flavobacterium cauense R2A-7 TaxID=1341154 RepID=V6RVU3_9FLAO|nr:DUF4294 domain-containing protein [Flavobacterium cauense]ESU18633.1 hypothetical protein FCR2A7T_29330 [Flavobacterium cauense R2A-7]TWI11869.1 uncharacterized protein DUF4294 [Flavobacterium cauense R2A-7]